MNRHLGQIAHTNTTILNRTLYLMLESPSYLFLHTSYAGHHHVRLSHTHSHGHTDTAHSNSTDGERDRPLLEQGVLFTQTKPQLLRKASVAGPGVAKTTDARQ